MNKLITSLCIATALLLSACSDAGTKSVSVSPVKELITQYDSVNYNTKAWKAGNYETPRYTFSSIGKNWKEETSHIPVQDKKSVFFRLMLPLILMSNEEIVAERAIVKEGDLSDSEVIDLALKYKVIKESVASLTKEQKAELLHRVDIIPPSLAVAQASEESGWGTSRFALEGNAFFGQWDFSGGGMKPKNQRKELGNYGVASFDSPLESVKGYMLNINTGAAYKSLRQKRAMLRSGKHSVTGLKLTTTLIKYSERGQAYIDGLQSMIRHNKLEGFDKATLIDAK